MTRRYHDVVARPDLCVQQQFCLWLPAHANHLDASAGRQPLFAEQAAVQRRFIDGTSMAQEHRYGPAAGPYTGFRQINCLPKGVLVLKCG